MYEQSPGGGNSAQGGENVSSNVNANRQMPTVGSADDLAAGPPPAYTAAPGDVTATAYDVRNRSDGAFSPPPQYTE